MSKNAPGDPEVVKVDTPTDPPATRKRKVEKAPARLNTAEVDRFFRACKKSIRDTAIFTLMGFRGLRASEVGLMKLSDWDHASGKLQVNRLKGSWCFNYKLNPVEVKALRAWIRIRGDAPGPMFPSKKKVAISRVQIWRLMQYYCELAKIPKEKAHPHAWKHRCGFMQAEQGADLLDIQEVLGHKNISNTRLYIVYSEKRRDDHSNRSRNWRI